MIEKKKLGDDDWSKVASLSPSDTSATIKDLEPNADYEFRVRAVNAAGTGEPSLPSDLCKMLPKRSKSSFPRHKQPTPLLINRDSDIHCTETSCPFLQPNQMAQRRLR